MAVIEQHRHLGASAMPFSLLSFSPSIHKHSPCAHLCRSGVSRGARQTTFSSSLGSAISHGCVRLCEVERERERADTNTADTHTARLDHGKSKVTP